jgi:hypothetical protein
VALPLIRLTVVARVRAITGRAVSLDAVEIAVLRGYVALRGFRIADRAEGAEPSPSSTGSICTCGCLRSFAATCGCARRSRVTPRSA